MSQFPNSSAVSRDDLLAERTWIQSLAKSLVGSGTCPEDVAQDTWVIALQNPPREAKDSRGLRRWLAAVVRRVAKHDVRSVARRQRRHEEAAKPVAVESTHDVVERFSLQRRVAEAVLDLSDPYRSTLLYFYFDGLSIKAIAERTDSNSATVRQHLARGRGLLRDALDREYGGDSRTWLRGLALADGPRGSRQTMLAPLGLGLAALGIGALLFFWQGPDSIEPKLAYAQPAEPDEEVTQDLVVASLSHAVPLLPQEEEPGSVAAKLTEELGLHFFDLVALEVRKPRGEIEALAESAMVKPELLLTADLFSGKAKHPRTGKRVNVLVARLFLPELGPEARIVLAVAGWRIIGVGIWGTTAFDEDPDQRWGHFAGQLMVMGSKVEIGTDSETAVEFEQRLELLAKDEENGEFIRALWQQRSAMLGNMLYQRAMQGRDESSELASVEWFAGLAGRMGALADRSHHFERVFGTASAKHQETARQASKLYEALGAAAREGDKSEFAQLGDKLGELCHACHDALLSDGETTWFDAFDPVAAELELPRGMLRVGIDLSPALGDEGEVSQRLATALRAGLVYLDSLK